MVNRRLALLTLVGMSTVALAFGGTRPSRASAHKNARTMSMQMHMTGQNQFHFPASKGHGALMAQRQAGQRLLPGTGSHGVTPMLGAHSMGSKRRPVKAGSPVPPPSSTGFVSATQIPAGGYLTGETLLGDFNGDGIADFVSIVGNPSIPGTFSFSVVLGNGDGTFQAPVLTASPGNMTDPFGIGDVNNDGLDDVIFVHQPGTSANFDVLLSNGDGTFTVGNNYALGSNNLSGGAVADFDGDGKLDLVAVDSATPGNVWVSTGNGDGTFNAATSVLLGEKAGYDVVIADLNGDGMLDITGNDDATGQQKVFLATSRTAFAASVPYTTPDGIYDACATRLGDLNGDGKPEIVNSNCTDDTITIYVNDGSGGFAQGVYYNVSSLAASGAVLVPHTNPVAASIGDVNGDGFPDIVVTNNYSGDVTVLLGNGDGTVGTASVGYAVGGSPVRPAIVADLNGDGLADVAVPDDFYSFVYMKGYGDGTFQAAVDTYAPASDGGSPHGFDIATGDLNGDGFADVVIGNCCDVGVGVTVFLSNPNGGLLPGVNYGSGGGMKYVAIADFDGDGKLDIAASDQSNGVVQIFKGDGTGAFTATNSYSSGAGTPMPAAVVVADVNKDGHPDLVVANSNGSSIGVLVNDGTGGFLPVTEYPVCSSTDQVSVADVNGDGFADIVAPIPSCTGVATMLNAGDGTFGPELDLGVGNHPYQIAIGDLNGDGIPDLAITRDDFVNGHGITVATNDGTGTFTVLNSVAYPTSLQLAYYQPLPTYIRLADLDGDGKLDLVYTNTNYGTVGVMYGVGDGTFYDPVEYPTSSYSFGLALGDVNGDGAPDAVTAVDFTAGVTTLINNSGSGAKPDYTVAANPSSQTVTAGGDGLYTFTLTPRNFYNGTVTFTCGTLPSKTTCSFTNPTLTPNGNGAMTTTLMLKTTATVTTMAAASRSGFGLAASMAGIGLFGLMLAGDWRKHRRVGIIMAVVMVGLVITLVGCGGNSTPPQQHQTIPGTPVGSYTVTVTATGTAGTNGGSTAPHAVNVTLNVQ